MSRTGTVRLSTTEDVLRAARRLGIDPGPLEAACVAYNAAAARRLAFADPGPEQRDAQAELAAALDRTRNRVTALLSSVDQLARTATDPYTRTVVAALTRLRDTPEEG